ncbi:MAG: PKD domain-containing protein [Bacteroidales bacterium]|nr:PKD domain-containing protein [Bacteroidales bacterium]
MNCKSLLVIILITCFSFLMYGQSDYVYSSPDLVSDVLFKEGERKIMKAIDYKIWQEVYESRKRADASYVIPVVVHIIHNNGSENITDAQIIKGIKHLNDAFANTLGGGVNTDIQFCLAVQDPDGKPTTGINRIVSSLTNMDSQTQDQMVKDLIRWDTKNYMNIWLVKEVSSGSNTSVAGYAYLPSSHGAAHDGIVMESQFFGSSYQNSSVITHEMGHYLGLYHTFEGGCKNNDCTKDGDKICDTPPDGTSFQFGCADKENSCTSDVDDISLNNPFRPIANGGLGDQIDMQNNFMDYSDWACYAIFTKNQKSRMQAVLDGTRKSLLNSLGCQTPCKQLIVANYTVLSNDVEAGVLVQFTNVSTGGKYYDWKINGVSFSDQLNTSYTFTEQGIYLISLTVTNDDIYCSETFTDTIKVNCDITTSFLYTSNSVSPGDIVHFTNTSQNAVSYEWFVNGVAVSVSKNLSYTFKTAGNYEVWLIADNGVCKKQSSKLAVTVAVGGLPQTGIPVWPMAVSGKVPAQTIDWRNQVPVNDEISSAITDGGMTGAGFGNCGELLFYVLHSGSVESNNLFIYAADGTPLLDNTVNSPGLNAIRGGQEIQVIPVPKTPNHWYIIYKKWSTDVGAWASGLFTPENWLYSKIKMNGDNSLTVIERDIALKDNMGISYTYVDGAAVSRTASGNTDAHYLYLSRIVLNVDNFSVDRFIIDDTGIHFDKNSGNIPNTFWRGCISGSPIELSPTEDKLAVVIRNDYFDKPTIFIFDAQNLTLLNSICAYNLFLVNDGNIDDESSIHPVGDLISNVAATNANLQFLININRRIPAIEFSPNGKFLYFVGGGYATVQGHYCITYLGQINLESTPLEVRLQIQDIPGADYTTGLGCTYAACATTCHAVTNGIQSCYDGNLYYLKINTKKLMVIPDPNNFMPQNLIPSEVDIATADEPNIPYAKGLAGGLIDQIDGYNYLENGSSEVFVSVESFDCMGRCIIPSSPLMLELRDQANNELVRTYTIDTCPAIFPICVNNLLNYSLSISEKNKTYLNAILQGKVMYASLSFVEDSACTEICDNNLDDDNDGLIDYFDSDCECQLPEKTCDIVGQNYFGICNNCQFIPELDMDYDIKVLWETDPSIVINNTVFTCVGDIDGDCNTEVLVTESVSKSKSAATFEDSDYSKSNKIHILDGKTGKVKYTINTPICGTNQGNVAIADVDNDGLGDIFIYVGNYAVNGAKAACIIRYEFNGVDGFDEVFVSEKIQIYTWSTNYVWFHQNKYQTLNIADVNYDGVPELCVGTEFFNTITGEKICAGPSDKSFGLHMYNPTFKPPYYINPYTVLADVLPDDYCADCSGLELIAGNMIYTVSIPYGSAGGSGNVKLAVDMSTVFDIGTSSVADMDLDGKLDIISETRDSRNYRDNKIYVWNPRTKQIMAETTITTDNYGIGRIAVGDIDGAPEKDIEIVARVNTMVNVYKFNLITSKLDILGSLPTIDPSATAVSLFDFNGDMALDVVYRGETSLQLFDGKTLKEVATMPFISGTYAEYPVIADLNGDGSPEIRLGHDYTLRCVTNALPARSVWNQATYFGVNINDDLTIPRQQQIANRFLALNSFQAQLGYYDFNGEYVFPAPDATVAIGKLSCVGSTVELELLIHNLGIKNLLAEIPLTLYNGSPYETGATIIKTIKLGKDIAPGDSILIKTTLNASPTMNVFAVVNDDGKLLILKKLPSTTYGECNYDNNIDTVSFNIGTGKLDLGKDTVLCSTGGILLLDAGDSFVTYKWQDFSDLSTYTAAEPGVYSVTVTDGCGNEFSDAITITVDDTELDIIKDTSICLGNDIMIFTDLFVNYEIKPFVTIIATHIDSVLIRPSSAGVYVLEGINKNGCFISDTFEIVETVIDQNILGNDTSICQGDTLHLEIADVFDSYLWSTGETTKDVSITNTQILSVIVNTNGCFGYDTIAVTEIPKPDIELGNDTAFCIGSSIELDVSISDPFATYVWDDGSINATRIISNSGTYSVTVSNEFCSISDSVTISLDSIIKIDLGNDTILCESDTLLIDISAYIGSYEWQDGSSSATYLITQAGDYSVTITNTSCGYLGTIKVDMVAKPDFSLPDDTSICEGSSLAIDVSEYALDVVWSDNVIGSTRELQQPNTYIATASNLYCEVTDSIVLTLLPSPVIDLGNEKSLCANESVEIGEIVENAQYLWSTGSTDAKIEVSTQGLYTVTVTVGNCSAQDSVRIVLKPTPDMPTAEDVSTCFGSSKALAAQGENITWYADEFKNQVLANTSTYLPQIVSGIDSYNFYVSQTVAGCESPVRRVQYKLDETSNSLIIEGDDSVCVFEEELIYTVLGASETLQWSVSNSIPYSSDASKYAIEIDWVHSGIDTISVTSTDDFGCLSKASLVVYIAEFPIADFEHYVDNQVAFFSNLSTQKPIEENGTILDIAIESYWDFGRLHDTLLYQQPYNEIKNKLSRKYDAGVFNVELYTRNAFGCADTVVYSVPVDIFCSLYLPNAMAPLHFSDKVASFKPTGTNLGKYEIWIYDKWGNLMWYSDKLTEKGNPAEAWDGIYDGNPVSSGSYIWKIEAQCIDKTFWKGIPSKFGKHKKMGSIQVVR